MKIELNDDKDLLYYDIIQLLREIRITLSPADLKATLNRHKAIMAFLLDYQKCSLKELEDRIDAVTKMD